MLEISMQTALLIYSICFIVGLMFTAYQFYLIKERRDDIRHFVHFNFLATAGSLLIVFRESISPFLSIVVSNLLLVVAYGFLVYGTKKLIGSKSRYRVFISIVLIWLLLHLYFVYIDFQVLYRVHIYNAAVLSMLGYAIYSLFKSESQGKELMTYVMFLMCLAIMVRGVNLLLNVETSNQFLGFKVDPIFVVIMGISNVLSLVGLLSLLNYQSTVELIESERSKTSLLSNLPGFAYRCLNDEHWTMKFLSKGFKDVTGYENDEVLENKVISFQDIIVDDYRDYVRESWNQVIREKDNYQAEYKVKRKDGSIVWVLEQGVGIYDENNECIAIEGFIADIDIRKNMENSLEFLSYRDYLTGLYNRRYIEEQIYRLENSRNVPISVIMGDINGLKFINDSFGHTYGDELIKTVGKILKQSLRGYELISRLSGDEFLVILENTEESVVGKIVDRIIQSIKEDEFSKMGLSVSFGYATKTEAEMTMSETLKLAEDMMYQQKHYLNPSSRRKTVDTVLATLFEKDKESEIHSRNVAKYSKKLAKAAGLKQSDIQKTATAGLLHDVGKIIIDASILKSTQVLSDDEYNEIKKHSEIGYRILYNVEELREIANIILCHHERPDGLGYPNQLKDKDIPYISKIISICDAYDAMIHERRYKDTLTEELAYEELRKHAGKQFDKELVEIFIDLMKSN